MDACLKKLEKQLQDLLGQKDTCTEDIIRQTVLVLGEIDNIISHWERMERLIADIRDVCKNEGINEQAVPAPWQPMAKPPKNRQLCIIECLFDGSLEIMQYRTDIGPYPVFLDIGKFMMSGPEDYEPLATNIHYVSNWMPLSSTGSMQSELCLQPYENLLLSYLLIDDKDPDYCLED